jgi:hypothetical protein
MKQSLAVLFVMVLMVFSMNAMADSSDCPSAPGPVYPDTGTSIR